LMAGLSATASKSLDMVSLDMVSLDMVSLDTVAEDGCGPGCGAC